MDIVTLNSLFSTAIEIEKGMGTLYKLLAERCLLEYQKKFFRQLEDEERNHAEMLRMQRRMLVDGKVEVTNTASNSELDEILNTITAAIKNIEGVRQGRDEVYIQVLISDVVKEAILLEEKAALAHSGNLVSVLDENTKAFFGKLASDDTDHMNRLMVYLASDGKVES
jgi:rubrerythrin